jgi:hypothetical protein
MDKMIVYGAIFNRLSWTADTKHGRIISDEQTIEEVRLELNQEIDQVIADWIANAKYK